MPPKSCAPTRLLPRSVVTGVVAFVPLLALPRFGALPAEQPGPAAAKPEGESYFFTPPGSGHEGKPATASGEQTGRLHIVVRDQSSGKPTFCRLNVVGHDGNYYQPPTNYLSRYALTGEWPKPGNWGNRAGKAPYRYLGRFFYSWGEATVEVPAGPVRVEVWKGFEYRPQTLSTHVPAGATRQVEVTLAQTAVMARHGYHGGDPHLHFARASTRDEDTILDLLEAEDIHYGAVLGYNEPAGRYLGFMDKQDAPQHRGLGTGSARQRGAYHILSGQEYRSSTYGHINLYLRDELLFPGQTRNADHWPVYGEVGQDTQARGGYAIYAHGGYAQEIYADAVQGAVNAVELLQFGIYRGIGLEDWYHILNTGYRFPCMGASDYPACRWLGDCRTYVVSPTPPTFPEWLRGMVEGRSFVTTGPLLFLEVDGHKPGAILTKTGKGPHTVTARVRALCEVTPVTHLELIVNGRQVHRLTVPPSQGKGNWLELEHALPVNTSSWIAARAYSTTPGGQPDAEAHTNPVYVYLDGRAPYQQAALDAWLERIDKQIATHAKRMFAEKSRVLTYFQRSRDLLLRIRQEGGLAADARPAQWAREMAEAAGKANLAADGSIRNPSDEELKEFLKPLPPKAPQEALKTFETVDGFRMELVAAEPLVHDPVAAAFDEDGNLYVAEMRDYPYKPAPGKRPLGCIRLLRDTNGDGVFDESHVFADHLLWAAGIAPWKGGVFVAAPPDIWYFKDTDGDYRADVRRKVYTGFGTENQQAMLNNLQLGLDHKIYGATAGNGGSIRPADDPNAKPVVVSGRDFRFDPMTEVFETITGTVQFGNTFDDWGNRFLCSESQPLLHAVLPYHYLARNPYLPVPAAIKNLAPGPVPIYRISPIERWRHIRSSRRIAQNERSAEGAGASHHVVDAATGVTIYRGGAYPKHYYGHVFVGDAQNNLVHRRLLLADGVTFQSRRADEKTEFGRSSDIWFRPVNFVNAPDGTLYCLDMSREVLESIHIPLDVVKHLDLTNGRNNGRIYRMAPVGFRSPLPPRLSRASGENLVAALESPHGWWRDTAHRLIYERQDPSLVPALERLATTSSLPQARVHALWSLHGLRTLNEGVLAAALGDESPRVREHAVRLAEPRLDQAPALAEKVLALARDADARVRFQVAFTLGETNDPRAVTALAELARKHADDAWMRTAILSSVAEWSDQLLVTLLQDAAFVAGSAGSGLIEQLALVVGVRSRPTEVERVLHALATSPTVTADGSRQQRFVLGLGAGLKRAGGRLAPGPQTSTPSSRLVLELLASARKTATDVRAAEPARQRAIQLLSCGPFAQVHEALKALLDVQQPQSIQIAAARALSDYAEAEVADLLLAPWRQYAPEVRQEVVQAMLAREERALALLRAAEKGDASTAQIDPTRRELLLKHRNEAIRQLATRLFGSAAPNARSAVLADYKSALPLRARVANGEKVFEKNCMACHQLGTKGHAIGPNLASSPARDPEALLTHILDPNQYVLPNYVQYVLVNKKGRVFTGMIAAQTATSVTLKREKDLSDTILRSDIEELNSTGKSLMPEGVEKDINKQEMADLLAFLQEALAKYGSAVDANRVRDFGTLPGLVEPEKKE
ncbi:MAG: CehA/McbA family metallohydrolase [Gemmataceae bacterium]|nr:CehA/McbA family metallohydrolase [Gemmataceae bacterium]